MKTKVRTNSKAVREAIRTHILESVYNYEGEQFDTLEKACNHMNSEFERVQGHMFGRANHQELFHYYLMGLPFDFLFYDEDILNYLNGLGLYDSKPYDRNRTAELYTYLIYAEMLKNKSK